MLPPGMIPRLHGPLRKIEHLRVILDRPEDLVDHIDDLLGGAVGNLQVTRKDPLPGALVVVVEDIKEELRVASPPRVDRLLGVPHVEE